MAEIMNKFMDKNSANGVTGMSNLMIIQLVNRPLDTTLNYKLTATPLLAWTT